jgi:predicted HicB family RNase H-like nuclease
MCQINDIIMLGAEDSKMARRGRPKVPKAEYKGKMLLVRLTGQDMRRLDAAAQKAGVSRPEFARRAILEVLR